VTFTEGDTLKGVLEAVIFDLDGTLVDTPQAIVETALASLAGRVPVLPAPAAIRATIGLPLTVAFSGLLGRDESSALVQEAVAEYRRIWRKDVVPRSAEMLYPGVAAGLAELRALGLRLAVATSKVQAGAVAQLEAAGVAHAFEVIAGFDSVERPKPDPQIALHVLDRLGVAPGAAVAVGDTTHDLTMAHGARLRTIAVTYGAHSEAALRAAGPGYLASDFPEAVRLVRKLVTRP
jgi:phosphoglycolate phosphatase